MGKKERLQELDLRINQWHSDHKMTSSEYCAFKKSFPKLIKFNGKDFVNFKPQEKRNVNPYRSLKIMNCLKSLRNNTNGANANIQHKENMNNQNNNQIDD